MSKATCETHGHVFGVGARCVMCGANPSGGSPPMTTERCPQCDDNNRCGHEWHGDTWEHQAATVIRGLEAERDTLRAREAKLREALNWLKAQVADYRAGSTKPRSRRAADRGEIVGIQGTLAVIAADIDKAIARAALAEGEDTRG